MSGDESTRARWGRFRFSVIGPLLASPPEHGELAQELAHLAGRAYRHPTTGESVRFGLKTIERWYYLARNHPTDPVGALARKTHPRAGTHPKVSAAIAELIRAQHREHSRWSYQLHHDNLTVLVQQSPELGELPSYPTLCRFMKAHGLRRRKGRRRRGSDLELEPREVRSYEVTHVHGLWHLDFHEGSLRVLTPAATWVKPWLFGCLDDRSRVACHLQWYLLESAETLVHGFSQALLKRDLPRGLMSDNGGAETAAEVTEGLERLGIVHHTTLPYHPEQNAKQEAFWGQIEGRLLPMLEGYEGLTLPLLNEATQAWVELEYHRKPHSELGATPLEVFTSAPSVGRPAPSAQVLRRAFRMQSGRKQRRSDGTVTVEGIRFEIPSAYRTLERVQVRYARWDLSSVDLVDPRSGAHLAALYPLDKRANADGRRRTLEPPAPREAPAKSGIAPLLKSMMSEYSATGLPPAYLAGPETYDREEDDLE
ncbi:MAG: transposase [Sandaracinaceae bacterium]|nr:transposase [Sandaracinaceae bacterium]